MWAIHGVTFTELHLCSDCKLVVSLPVHRFLHSEVHIRVRYGTLKSSLRVRVEERVLGL